MSRLAPALAMPPRCTALIAIASFSTSLAQGSFSFCNDMLLENLGPRCKDGSAPLDSGCCAGEGGGACSGMDCCPKGCTGMSSGGGKCTCTGCTDTMRFKLKMTEAERWVGAHSYLRCRHGHPPVEWQDSTYQHAKAWADQCTYAHSGPSGFENGGAGENLATSSYSQDHAPETATERWYSEISTANGGKGYKAGTASNDAIYAGESQVGHYTALIWKSVSKIGCATCPADSKGWEINVCQYADESPNMIGGEGGVEYFVNNVPQDNTPTATEEECCASTYGSYTSTDGGGSGSTGGSTGSGDGGSSDKGDDATTTDGDSTGGASGGGSGAGDSGDDATKTGGDSTNTVDGADKMGPCYALGFTIGVFAMLSS
eukprot:gnl/TRDRNA2_/TRDRNA2_40700_c0_seq1.p1 gnl/TRDRNA2_/TRDRNA2_40700_c0~~gnl/TRDRNA2_/TRDRNA2_40700_c0_seq1.p1  ORF type:complete len:373 (-),score=46.74 gnl/TRDRNA2_/TRDRNA2_40700_c0_seq1:156-1274(-)